MRLFRLTFATILRRKSWAVCVFALVALPFILPEFSMASERPVILQPARIQATWGVLWISTLFWGLFTASRQGESNARSGLGEYFLTTGVGAPRQWFQIWLAVLAYIIPLALLAAVMCLAFALPKDPVERSMWWVLNFQYVALFLLAVAPLLGLAIALASRFGGIAGFTLTLGLALYGLYGVGYLDNMLKQEPDSLLQTIWQFSPQYRWADLTQRLYFKLGALPAPLFWKTATYFTGILALYAGLSRLIFRTKSAA